MPAAAVISSGVHERSIAVVKTFLVDMIREVCEGCGVFVRGGFALACGCVLPSLLYNRHGPYGPGCTLSKLERFRQALFLEAMNTLAWNARIGLSFGRAGEEPSHV